MNLTTQTITESTPDYIKVIGTSRIPLWCGFLNPFSGTVFITNTNIKVLYGGEHFANVIEGPINVRLVPKTPVLSGHNITTKFDLQIPHEFQAIGTTVIEQQLLHGYVHVTTEGTFGLKMGNLHLLLSQKQIDIPSCGLHYVQQTAVNESACGTPRADIITDP